MLALWITCIVVLPVLALVTYVVRRSKPGRFRLSAKVFKLLDISIEVDGQDGPDKQSLAPRSTAAPVDGER